MLFGSNPQEAADLAAIAYRTSALSLIPVANAFDGFAASHMMSEAYLPEPELPCCRVPRPGRPYPRPDRGPGLLFGAKGRVFQLTTYVKPAPLRHRCGRRRDRRVPQQPRRRRRGRQRR